MSVAALVLAGLLAAQASADPIGPVIGPYRVAAAAGAVGVVSGRALTESLLPDVPDHPVADVSVTLLPRSEALLRRLEEIRRQARVDLEVLRASAGAVIDARRAWERALADAGAADLVRYTAVGPDGRFDLEEVPAGQWVILAERAQFVDKAGSVGTSRERTVFRLPPRLLGYWTVTFWLQEVDVRAGGFSGVQLTDRNAWMTAIAEKREE